MIPAGTIFLIFANVVCIHQLTSSLHLGASKPVRYAHQENKRHLIKLPTSLWLVNESSGSVSTASQSRNFPNNSRSTAHVSNKRTRSRQTPLSQRWYKSKQKHISKAQKKLIQLHWPNYGIDLQHNTTLNLRRCFNATAEQESRYVLDIGFGDGDSICFAAENNPSTFYLGCELHRASIAKALLAISEQKLHNVRILRVEAQRLLESHLPQKSYVEEINVYFPDPWPNLARDGERRIIRPHMIDLFERVLRPGGLLRIATDACEYADHVSDVMIRSGDRTTWHVNSLYCHSAAAETPQYRAVTRYERKAAAEGRMVWDFEFQWQGLDCS